MLNEDIAQYSIPTDIILKYEPRPQQNDILDFFVDSVKTNKKFILIDASVGIGKSFAVMMMANWYKQNYNPTANFDVITNSKILQEQYTRDFEFLNSLWGKDNYECERHSTNCGVGSDIGAIINSKCENCPYMEAKDKFFDGEISLTNYHTFLTYKFFMPFKWERGSKVLIIDEAHLFEDIVCDFITTKISANILKGCGIEEDDVKKIMNAMKHKETLDNFVNVLDIVKVTCNKMIKYYTDIITDEHGDTKRFSKYISNCKGLLSKIKQTQTEYEINPSNWCYEKTFSKKDEVEYTVQPVWAYPYMNLLWDEYDHIIFLSGTILNKEIFVQLNGLNIDTTSYLCLPSPFEKDKRPIYILPVGKMTYDKKIETFMEQAKVVKKILKKHSSEKGIIHTVNYELCDWIIRDIADSRLLTHKSDNRQQILDIHTNSKLPTILVSPSMTTGIDLKDDLSRFQIILKMPYPNLQSEKIKKRNETNKSWYGYKTVMDLIQSTGRSVRNENDYAKTYIIDSCFLDLKKYNSKYIPQYIQDAFIIVK